MTHQREDGSFLLRPAAPSFDGHLRGPFLPATPTLRTEANTSPVLPRPTRSPGLLRDEGTGTSFTFWTGDMAYKPLAVKVALV